MTAIASLSCIAIDCPEPRELAEFYSAITGWPVDEDNTSEEWIGIRPDKGVSLDFQRVESYQAPEWPGQERPQQAHLDFVVDDLDVGEAAVLALGARKHEVQPGTGFRVFLDPVGHPFCLCLSGA
jgi:catechol 2,3-dioxygenase-like lactoylglutathione lyase family enzyme